ncbi:MAG: hypothetical protein PVF83_09775 [Anaerolineales bacterium]
MSETTDIHTRVTDAYHKRSGRYDLIVMVFDLFRSYGFDVSAWREASISAQTCWPRRASGSGTIIGRTLNWCVRMRLNIPSTPM